MLLIYQELVTFSVTKPTTTSKEEKKLDTSDLPEVVVCLDPGFDTEIMRKYNYRPIRYYRGVNDERTFVGWNGGKEETKSSREILEEALIVKSQHVTKFSPHLLTRLFENQLELWIQSNKVLKKATE